MDNNELLLAISDMLDAKLDIKLQPIYNELSGLKQDVSGLKQDVSGLKQDVSSLKQGQESIKQYITNNNVAIGDVITGIMERADDKVRGIEKITKENLYDIALLKAK